MSGKALNKDAKCRSLGFVNNPPRGYFRTLKTCYSAKSRCRVLAKGEVTYNASPEGVQVVGFGIDSITHVAPGQVRITLSAPLLNAASTAHRFVNATVQSADSQLTPECRHISFLLTSNGSPLQVVDIVTTILQDSPTACLHANLAFDFEVCECDTVTTLTADLAEPPQ